MAELSLFLTLVLLMSAAHKILEPERLTIAAVRLTGAPASLGPVVNVGVSALEVASAVALMFAEAHPVGALLAALIWSCYGVALASRFGTALDCGCSFASREKRIGLLAVARAFGLSLLALVAVAMPTSSLSLLSPFAAIGLLALYIAFGELSSIFIPERRGHA